jgi:hypothetical protein
MAKAAILNVLEDTIGRYVVGLDAKSLNVAVWAGKIELQALQLDVQAVNLELQRRAQEAPNFALPFRVVEGNFDALRVDVPWARIASKPVVLRASGLNVVIEPHDHLSSSTATKSTSSSAAAAVKTKTGKSPFKKKHKLQNQNQAPEAQTQTHTQTHPTSHAHDDRDEERSNSLTLAEESRQRSNAIRRLSEMHTDSSDGLDHESEGYYDDVDVHQSSTLQSRKDASAASSTFKARLVRRIIENLQLDIHDIHFSVRGQGCNIGASMDKFSIFTTDQDGNKSFIDRSKTTDYNDVQKSFLYKALQLEGLALFCNEQKYHLQAPDPNRTLHRSQRQKRPPLPKTYILSPLSFSTRLRQSDCLQCIDFPKYLLAAELPNVSFRLTRTQLELLHQIASEIEAKKRVARPLFPGYRPKVPITKQTAKLWWKYAVRSVGRISRKRSWTEFFLAYQKRKRYIQLYKRQTYSEECSWLAPLLIAERAELDGIEKDASISTQGIMIWRNMADAQVDLEFRKYEEREEERKLAAEKLSRQFTPSKKRTTLRNLLWGRADDRNSDSGGGADDSLLDGHDVSSSGHGDSDTDPPITLTMEEMRELDSLALVSDTEMPTLSTDSMLCDVSFEMGSFAVDLVTFRDLPLVSLEMGTVLSQFKANADGSFTSTFSLSSLNVYDRITRNSIFPVVIRSLESSDKNKNSGLNTSTFKNAIDLKLGRARNGDQSLEAKMVSYEIVACDVLLKEMKKFTNLVHGKKSYVPVSNPTLEYSVSGSADLFYDATDVGTSTMMASTILSDLDELSRNLQSRHEEKNASRQMHAPKVSDKLSSAFADAWKSKLEKQTVWSVQIDLHAPILVLPRSCVDPQATTLVVDLGTFRMTVGKQGFSSDVQDWFYKGQSPNALQDIKIDHCSLEMEHFSLTVARAGCKDWLQARASEGATQLSSESVIDPVTLNLHVGLENGGKSRKCVFGVMEQISLSISHSQIVKMVSLISYWGEVFESLSVAGDLNEGIGIIDEVDESDDEHLPSVQNVSISSNQGNEETFELNGDVVDLLHISIILQQFKARIVNNNESVEAHLLAATAAITKCSDGSSMKHLQMGHFWILDCLKGDYPRRQRLVAHSLLPLPASSYAQDGEYNILETFKGLEGDESSSINSLADIKITTATIHPGKWEFSQSPFTLEKKNIETTSIDAKFNTLQLHW